MLLSERVYVPVHPDVVLCAQGDRVRLYRDPAVTGIPRSTWHRCKVEDADLATMVRSVRSVGSAVGLVDMLTEKRDAFNIRHYSPVLTDAVLAEMANLATNEKKYAWGHRWLTADRAGHVVIIAAANPYMGLCRRTVRFNPFVVTPRCTWGTEDDPDRHVVNLRDANRAALRAACIDLKGVGRAYAIAVQLCRAARHGRCGLMDALGLPRTLNRHYESVLVWDREE